MKIDIGARVRTREGRTVGEVHRVIVDLDDEDKAVTGIVVLKGHLLSRDVLVPLDFIEKADPHEVVLRLSEHQLDQLPDFAYNEILAPPPTWTTAGPYPDGTVYVPIRERKRLGHGQFDIIPGTAVFVADGEIGHVDEVEVDPLTGELRAFWLHAGPVLTEPSRIPIDWVERADETGIHIIPSP